MSANNYIQIKEISLEEYHVSERDYETEEEIRTLGIFDTIRAAAKEAQRYVQECEYGIEYGINFSLIEKSVPDATKVDETDKNFDLWNNKKKLVHAEQPRLYTVREIWWCRLGVNVGSEQDGNGAEFLRPVLIIKGFGADTCLVVPLTSSKHKHFLRVPIGEVKGKSASALLSQLRVIDTRRLVEKIGFLEKDSFLELRKTVRRLF